MSCLWMLNYINSKGLNVYEDYEEILYDYIDNELLMMALETIQNHAKYSNDPYHTIALALRDQIRMINFEEMYTKYGRVQARSSKLFSNEKIKPKNSN